MVVTGFLSETLLTANKADPDMKSIGISLTPSIPALELFLSVSADTKQDQASGSFIARQMENRDCVEEAEEQAD